MMTRVDPGIGPLLSREIMVALRRRRAAVMQIVGLGITSLVAIATGAAHNIFGESYKQGAEPFGRDIMLVTLGVVTFLLNFVTPALTATAITEERERRTLDLLLVTRMAPPDIVLAKLLTGFLQGLLFVAASFPAVAFGYLYGGVAVSDLVFGYALILLLMAVFVSLGMYASSRAPVTRMAVGGAYGLGAAVLVPTLGSLFPLAFAYRQGSADSMVAGLVVVMALVCTWLATGCTLGAVTAISPASRDPGPSARKALLYVAGSAVVAAGIVGFFAEADGAEIMGGVLFGGLMLVLLVASILLATEDTPARMDAAAPLWWRSNALVGVIWIVVISLVVMTLVPTLALREVTGPFLSTRAAFAMVPFFASCAGMAAVTRLINVRRPGRRLIVGAFLILALTAPLVLALLTEHGNFVLAPSWMMLWLHPLTLVLATRPAATLEAGATGPFGIDIVVCFVVGHLLIAVVGIALGHIFGKPAPRME